MLRETHRDKQVREQLLHQLAEAIEGSETGETWRNLAITAELYKRGRKAIQHDLDDEFYEPRYRDARQADQGTLRVAASSLDGERFTKADLDGATKR